MDERLALGQDDPVADRFTRVALPAAAQPSRIVWPPGYDFVSVLGERFPGQIRERVVYDWALRIYARHRRTGAELPMRFDVSKVRFEFGGQTSVGK